MQHEEERIGTRATRHRGRGRDGHSAGTTGQQSRLLAESRSLLRGVGDAIGWLVRPLAPRSDELRMPGSVRTGPKTGHGLTAATAAIGVIVCLLGAAGPAAADNLVSNRAQSATPATDDLKLDNNDVFQKFTTGTNASGYCVESISIEFAVGSASSRDPVYVYLQTDNGAGRPNLPGGGQVTRLTKNGYNWEPPDTGRNRYWVRTAPRAENPWCPPPSPGVYLAASTDYWVYMWAGSNDTTAQLQSTNSGSDTGGTTGWSISDTRLTSPEGSGRYTETSSPLKIDVYGRLNSGPRMVIQARVSATEGVDEAAEFQVTLDKAAFNVVTVDYETVNQTAFAPGDFEATSGTLTFQPGETVKTVSVPIVDDDDATENDEVFNLKLSNASGATIALATGVATIVNKPVVKVSINDVTATEGVDTTADFTITLNPAGVAEVRVTAYSQTDTAIRGLDFTSNAETFVFAPGDTEKTYSVTIIDDTINDGGETFNVRLINLSGAVFAEGGDLGIGTILNDEDLEASFHNVPQDHDGSNTFTFQVHFTNDVSITPATMRDHAFTVTNGDVTAAARINSRDDRWLITVDPDGDDAVTITLAGNRACGTQGAICSDEDNAVQLGNSPSATVAAAPDGTPLTASFSNVPDEHTGADFTFDLAFTDELAAGFEKIKAAFRVSGGSINRVNRKTKGSDLGWNVKVRPAGTGELTITLPATAQCSSSGAICTDDGRRLSNSPSATVSGTPEVVETTPTVSIAGGSGTEGDDDDIDFTVTLDEAATDTVTVDYATSDGTADAGDDYTAKSGTLSFSAGTTSKTISVSIEDDIENESDETFTVTLSNASGADLGTASATGTIRNRTVEPLTARFDGMPSEHDGSEFTFELHFSENPEAAYGRLRDHAFTLSGNANVNQAQRKTQGSNQSWTIQVDPKGNERVTITLPATTNCNNSGAICTSDSRKLSHATSATVAGPPSISVADATVTEAAGAVLAFTVSLSRSSGNNVTVDYATSDGTATAGADYTATSGLLTIDAGSTSATVDVTVLDDSHDDGGETLTLTLSNPSNGTLNDATATGTIENSDPLPKALVARFGRTAALHVVEQVEERVNAPRAPGFDGRVAGRQINRDMGRDFALDFLKQLGGGGYGYRQTQPGGRMTAAGTSGPQVGNSGRTSSLGPQNGLDHGMNPGGMQGLHPGQAYDGGMGTGLGGDRLLGGSSFALNRATSSGGVISFWSRSAQSSFYGQDGALALNGDVRSTMFGADYSKGRMVTGVSLAHTRGLGGYAGVDSGQMTSAVTGLYPWIGYKASERVTVWTVAGYGAGGLLLSPGAGTPIETGLSMAMAAGGGRGQILGGGEGFGLAFKADALWVGTRTDESNGPGGHLRGTSAAVNRLRTALEGSQSMELGGRMALTPSVEVGIRQDGGDAETGTGMDVGAGLVFADAVTGLSVDVRVRTLVVHQAEGYAERGVSISVSYNPTPSTPLGFTGRVSPAWGGDSMSGAEALWGRETMGGMGGNHLLGGGGNRLDTEVGYGLPIGTRFIGTPRAGMRTSEYGRDYRVGYGMQVLEQGRVNLQLGIDAERRESPVFHLQEGSAGTDQRVLGRATVQW